MKLQQQQQQKQWWSPPSLPCLPLRFRDSAAKTPATSDSRSSLVQT
jgi:hypothetical protein